jgi:hypothetical protein
MDHRRELEMLSEFNQIIAGAEMTVMEQIAELGKPHVDEHEAALQEHTLREFTDSLAVLKDYRELIVETMQQIDTG